MKAELQKQIEDLKIVRDNLDQMDIEDKSKQLARACLTKEIRTLNSKLDTVKQRERTKLDTFESNGKLIDIPRGLMNNSNVDYLYEDGVIYQFKKPYLDKDGSMYLWHYVWLDEGKRQTKLLVRTLGKDIYGDRYYLEASYYKDKKDAYPYMKKYIDANNQKYKIYVNTVIEYIRKHEGFEDYFKQ